MLRNLINSAWQPQFVAIVDGVQQLTADVHPAVGGWLSELILTLREAGFPLSNAHGEPPADGPPRRESVLALLAFLFDQIARSQVMRVDTLVKEPS